MPLLIFYKKKIEQKWEVFAFDAPWKRQLNQHNREFDVDEE